jgi:hypothetical protein
LGDLGQEDVGDLADGQVCPVLQAVPPELLHVLSRSV